MSNQNFRVLYFQFELRDATVGIIFSAVVSLKTDRLLKYM